MEIITYYREKSNRRGEIFPIFYLWREDGGGGTPLITQDGSKINGLDKKFQYLFWYVKTAYISAISGGHSARFRVC